MRQPRRKDDESAGLWLHVRVAAKLLYTYMRIYIAGSGQTPVYIHAYIYIYNGFCTHNSCKYTCVYIAGFVRIVAKLLYIYMRYMLYTHTHTNTHTHTHDESAGLWLHAHVAAKLLYVYIYIYIYIHTYLLHLYVCM
jgi:hypothetical protein